MSPENFDETNETSEAMAEALDSLRRSWRALPTPLSPPERDEDDSFRALGQVWRELPAPSAPQERQEADPRERAFLESLRAAWATLPVPPVPLDLLEAQRRVPAPGQAQPWARRLRLVAAAAAAILVAHLATDFPNHDGATGSAPDSPTDVAQGPSAASAGDLEPSSTSDSERTVTTQVAAVLTDNGIEMRSGPVRLLLLAGSQPFDSAPTSEPSQPSPERAPETPEDTRL